MALNFVRPSSKAIASRRSNWKKRLKFSLLYLCYYFLAQYASLCFPHTHTKTFEDLLKNKIPSFNVYYLIISLLPLNISRAEERIFLCSPYPFFDWIDAAWRALYYCEEIRKLKLKGDEARCEIKHPKIDHYSNGVERQEHNWRKLSLSLSLT